jgi:hypothetical protein
MATAIARKSDETADYRSGDGPVDAAALHASSRQYWMTSRNSVTAAMADEESVSRRLFR